MYHQLFEDEDCLSDDDGDEEEETTMKGARPCREYRARQNICRLSQARLEVSKQANTTRTKASRNLPSRTAELLTTSLACVSFLNLQKGTPLIKALETKQNFS